jgi:tripartite-type tricarboxylate transporter receptor subunit TctC
MAGADVKSQFTDQGIEQAILRGEVFGAFIRQDTEKWARVVKAAGVKAD